VNRALVRHVAWGVAIVAASAAVVALVATDVRSPARSLLVAAFVLVVPGFALLRPLRLDDALFELTLAVALSAAMSGFVAGVMFYADAVSPTFGLVILVGLAFVGVAVDIARAVGRQEGAT
jgi:uncharacterized membrane protein